MVHKFYYAKVGKGNELAGDYLSGRNAIKKPAIPIFFNCEPDNKADFLLHGNAKEQGRNFFECGSNNSKKTIVVVDCGKVIFSEPVGDVVFSQYELVNGLPRYEKLLPVKITKQEPISSVPAILAGITANAYYYSGTFREIRDPGNIKAIEALKDGNVSCSAKNDPGKLLECLSSFELETLIAKLLEENGCFVPAYRGGNMKGADIIACNDMSKCIDIAGLSVLAQSSISIQVKRSTGLSRPPAGVDYLVGLEVKNAPSCFDATWLIQAVEESKVTKEWLKRSLNWLPKSYLTSNGFS